MYTNNNNGDNNDGTASSSSSSSSSFNAYTVLSKTEEWISNTLSTANANANANKASSSSSSIPNNPYSRKEVSYSCENPQKSPVLIVSDLFRRLKEAREQGETHVEQEEQRKQEQSSTLSSSSYKPTTFRQTHVIVIPGHFETFRTFDQLIQAINQARRNARDYILDDDEDDDFRQQWNVAINCAHLHPQYGQLTPKQQLQQLQQEPIEVDVHLEQYKQARLMARRSPFPTVVIEVRATPVPEFATTTTSSSLSSSSVSAADIQRLEALFGQTAHMQSSNSFWDKIGNTIQEVSAVTPLKLAERFITERQQQQQQQQTAVALTESNLSQVDAAYEFVFLNAAMLLESQETDTYYLVLPHFLSTAATSLEKFAMETRNILQWILPASSSQPGTNIITVETFHPEHVDESKRSPVPIIALSKKKSNKKDDN
jgi:hypothetical protein